MGDGGENPRAGNQRIPLRGKKQDLIIQKAVSLTQISQKLLQILSTIGKDTSYRIKKVEIFGKRRSVIKKLLCSENLLVNR